MNHDIQVPDWYAYEYDLNRYSDRTPDECKDQVRRNISGLITLITRLFERNSRVLVIRVDLQYRDEIAPYVSMDQATQHRERLLSDRRGRPELFDGLLSYAWAMEQSAKDGSIHFHVLAFFDGAKRRDDVGIAFAMHDAWRQITNGAGWCYISNLDKEKFTEQGDLGIGMIHRNDVQARINLIENVAAYLVKKGETVQSSRKQAEGGDRRTFGKGQMPAPLDLSVPRRGRPPVK